MSTQEWIEAKRRELKAQQENAIGLANQTAGALKILDELQAELTKPEQSDDAAA